MGCGASTDRNVQVPSSGANGTLMQTPVSGKSGALYLGIIFKLLRVVNLDLLYTSDQKMKGDECVRYFVLFRLNFPSLDRTLTPSLACVATQIKPPDKQPLSSQNSGNKGAHAARRSGCSSSSLLAPADSHS